MADDDDIPCLGLCQADEQGRYCIGCGRRLIENVTSHTAVQSNIPQNKQDTCNNLSYNESETSSQL